MNDYIKDFLDYLIIDKKYSINTKESYENESFNNNLLDYPTYTKPQVYRDLEVPEVLLSGHHENINKWRKEESIKRTKLRRPDLLKKDD